MDTFTAIFLRRNIDMIFAILAFASMATAAKLDHLLLPPHVDSSGGADAGLLAPHNHELPPQIQPSYQAQSQPVLLAPHSNRDLHGNPDALAKTLRYENERNDDGYYYAYETSNGLKAEQKGQIIPGAHPEHGSLYVTGYYSYIGDDGHEYTVTYTAGEDGYHADVKRADPTRGRYDSKISSYDADAGLS
ncbi:uncharacterized protein LOC142979931 [Anticarsia gemmatalis]|uniref:uncharacterized protein LOC142979931 n=1 Tax=Anticarsia gemmatalis TaxID=129554 RepID=UPI003F771192